MSERSGASTSVHDHERVLGGVVRLQDRLARENEQLRRQTVHAIERLSAVIERLRRRIESPSTWSERDKDAEAYEIALRRRARLHATLGNLDDLKRRIAHAEQGEQ